MDLSRWLTESAGNADRSRAAVFLAVLDLAMGDFLLGGFPGRGSGTFARLAPELEPREAFLAGLGAGLIFRFAGMKQPI
jgi:hypothetical protein